MEINEQELGAGDSLQLNHNIKHYLQEIARWSRFLAICGYVFCAIFVLFSIYLIISPENPMNASKSPLVGMGIGVLYLVFSGLYFIPVNYLYKFSTKTKQALFDRDFRVLEFAFKNLKSLMKFTGIFTIVIIALYALIFFGAIIFKATM